MKTRLRLFDYYAIEGLSSMANALLLYCLFFYAKARFGFSDTENLFLGAAQGLTYIFAAKYGGRLAERIGYERVVLAGCSCLALLALTGALPSWRGWPFVLVLLYTTCIAPTWPALEAAITHVHSRMSMPERLGIYNLTWSLASAVGFFIGGPLFEWHPAAVLWVPGCIHLTQVAWLLLARKQHEFPQGGTSAMAVPHRGQDIAPDIKRRFLHTAWIANGASYFLSTAFIATIPYIGERLGLSPALAIWLTCSVLFSRTLGFLLFWRWERWHYRMSWSQAALWLSPLCALVVFFDRSQAVVFAALVVWGLAQALSYYTSIYYSMDYGERKGDHGGLHESILGMGVLAGPLAGAAGAIAVGTTVGGLWTILACAVLLSGVATAAAIRRATGGTVHTPDRT